MKLFEEVNTTGDYVRQVCLPETPLTETESFRRRPCVATGWGHSKLDGPLSDKLLEIHVPVQDNTICVHKYGVREYGNVKIKGSHICAGHLDGSSGTCVVSLAFRYFFLKVDIVRKYHENSFKGQLVH